MKKLIDTERFSHTLREKIVDVDARSVLITNYTGTEQEKDLSEPANCDGYGRIRHFRYHTSEGWPNNPLPIVPAIKALGLPTVSQINAQAFQNAACNWRCWYCYVPFSLLSGSSKNAGWLSCSQLIDLYLSQEHIPKIIDLTGGQPDLTPEWVVWMMRELQYRGIADKTYLWSDDNLSNDYFWQYLSEADINLISSYPNYGKVCCFKGFSPESFCFNTLAAPELYEQQFGLITRFLELNIDLYAYVTLTSISSSDVPDNVPRFIDRLQEIHEYLPLRTVPLEIKLFKAAHKRMQGQEQQDAIKNQWQAVEIWLREIEQRFTSKDRSLSITDIPLN